LPSLDAGAEDVSYAPVLHGLSLDPNRRLSNALLTRDEARRIAANVAYQSRGVRHDTATRQRIWPSCRSSHCHSRLSVFVSPTTVSLEASTSGRLYRRAFKAADWSDIATRKYSLSGGPPPPMRGVDEVIFQTLVMSPNMRSSAWLASRFSSANGALSSGHARTPPSWSVEELDNERRGRSASPPSSWAVSRNRTTYQYCNIRPA